MYLRRRTCRTKEILANLLALLYERAKDLSDKDEDRPTSFANLHVWVLRASGLYPDRYFTTHLPSFQELKVFVAECAIQCVI
jgi:hypothetical protein